jgi:hypothetical protein
LLFYQEAKKVISKYLSAECLLSCLLELKRVKFFIKKEGGDGVVRDLVSSNGDIKMVDVLGQENKYSNNISITESLEKLITKFNLDKS